MRDKRNTDVLSFEVCKKINEKFTTLSIEYDPIGNIIAAFYHDLVAHFTGIIIHREALGDYGSEITFPWVNKDYALNPFIYSDEQFSLPNRPAGAVQFLKRISFLPVSGGHSIPLGHNQQLFLGRALKILLGNPEWVQLYLPKRYSQIEFLESFIEELCHDYDIASAPKVLGNWRRHIVAHTTDTQPVIREKGILLGTRNDLHNRKLALNYMQQTKEVVGFTHSEISNHVLDEPVYGYSDKSLCTTLVDYGDFKPQEVFFPPIIEPQNVIRRSSRVIESRYRKNGQIMYRDLEKSRILFIPTMYQQNFLYGPKHAYESNRYYKWHLALTDILQNVTVKIHPKTRFHPKYECQVDYRQLDDCLDDYDLLVFDFFATATVLAIFSDKPAIYFDIGLRSLVPEFYCDLERRCTIVNIDFSEPWEDQIRAGLTQYRKEKRGWSNLTLSKYSLCEFQEFSLPRVIFDILRI